MPGSLAVRMFRAARRLLLPRDVGSPHEAEALTTAAALADDAARRGRGAAVAYWTAEFLSLVRAALAARRRDPQLPDDFIPSSRSRFMLSTVLHDVRYAFRLLRRTPGFTDPVASRSSATRSSVCKGCRARSSSPPAAACRSQVAGMARGSTCSIARYPRARHRPGSRTA